MTHRPDSLDSVQNVNAVCQVGSEPVSDDHQIPGGLVQQHVRELLHQWVRRFRLPGRASTGMHDVIVLRESPHDAQKQIKRLSADSVSGPLEATSMLNTLRVLVV